MKLFCLTLICVSSLFSNTSWIRSHIDAYSDFPKQGVEFQCYAKLLGDPKAFKKVIKTFAERYQDGQIDAIAGLDARGFTFGAALAYELELPFIMVRKPGKLPGDVEKKAYSLEYGQNVLEIQKNSIKQGQNVLVIDDLIATGGTAKAACDLIEKIGGNVYEVCALIELPFLKGRDHIGCPVYSLVSVDCK